MGWQTERGPTLKCSGSGQAKRMDPVRVPEQGRPCWEREETLFPTIRVVNVGEAAAAAVVYRKCFLQGGNGCRGVKVLSAREISAQ